VKKDARAGVRDAAGAGAAGRGRQRGGLTAGSGRAGGPLPLDNTDVARCDRVITPSRPSSNLQILMQIMPCLPYEFILPTLCKWELLKPCFLLLL